MQDVGMNRLENVEIEKISAQIASQFDPSLPAQQEYMTQTGYVPLLPTETGRKRHDAHQLKAPKFMQDLPECQQSQHTEMYLG